MATAGRLCSAGFNNVAYGLYLSQTMVVHATLAIH